MTEFNDHVKNANVELKPFPGAQANQLTNRSRTVLEENKYDVGVVHVGINDLLNRRNLNDDVLNDICDDIMNMGFRCRNYNIGTIFISGIAYSTRIDVFFLNRLNKKLQEACLINGFFFIDNGAICEQDLWEDGIHLEDSGKNIIANNVINNLNHFLFMTKHLVWNI